ncbi:MAG: MBL fold metallo-hydrolase [Candidatus Aenigmarchaeota archaeon]|nr:MBL fold metallo-hydrolase [Candidatus Aenigmarchaeota archaeon]
MEIKEIASDVYYIPNPANIGVISLNGNATFVDSGLDDDTIRKASQLVESRGFRPSRIINTHSHADHCGGNAWLQERYNIEIVAPVIESGIIMFPELEPLYLFSGASPPKELQSKFLKARPSNVNRTIPIDNVIIHEDVDYVPLPGHSPRQMGVAYNDVLFCADSVFPEEVLRKHKIPFFTDIEKQLDTLGKLRETSYKIYIPSHGDPFDDIKSMSDLNEQYIMDVRNYILENALHGKKTTEDVLQNVCDHYGVRLEKMFNYYLMNTAVMAYLSYFYKKGQVEALFEGNNQYWRKL